MSVFDEANERLIPLVDRPKSVRCLLPDHDDTKPSATLYPNGFYCHACGGSMSPLTYVSQRDGISISDLLDRLGFPKGRPPGENTYTRPGPDPMKIQDIIDGAENLDRFTKEWAIAKFVARYPLTYAPTNIQRLLTDPAFSKFCREKKLSALAIFDMALMIRDTEEVVR